MIKRYRVHLTGVVSTWVDVEVDTGALEDGEDPREAALDLAHLENRASLCHYCANHMNAPEQWHPGSWRQGPEDLPGSVEEMPV